MNRLPSKAAIAERAETEAKELFFLTLYLFIVFSALVFLKSAIMEADGVHWGYWGFAAIKAILVAKFMLIGRALHIGEGLRTGRSSGRRCTRPSPSPSSSPSSA